MPRFYSEPNLNRQRRYKTTYPRDLFVPYNAGRQALPSTKLAQGGFNSKPNPELVSLSAWITYALSSGFITVPGTGGTSYSWYSVNNECHVLATETGVTTNKASGILTITVPAGVEVLRVVAKGTNAELTATDSYIININFTSDTDVNENVATLTNPNVDVWDHTLTESGSISQTFPIIKDTTTTTTKITGVASNNMTVEVEDLTTFSSWAIAITL